MGTQAVVSLVNKRGYTVVKIVTGYNGFEAGKMAKWLKAHQDKPIDKIYAVAISIFENVSTVVVMDREGYIYGGEEELAESYRQTFHKPEWNPRWDFGTADYVKIVQTDVPASILPPFKEKEPSGI
jgi:hypothetical protein